MPEGAHGDRAECERERILVGWPRTAEEPDDADRPLGRAPRAPDYLPLEDCRTAADFERLDPIKYAQLIGTPATMLDVLKLQAQITAEFERLHEYLRQRSS